LKKAVYIFLFAFYTFGTLCLPLGDFSLLGEIPEMYSHCKATEDNDMTPIDFITDHLLNIDGIFDKHNHGDEQKPHKPIQSHHPIQTTISFINYVDFSINKFYCFEEKPSIHSMELILSDYITKIFRPPIV
jgi:hypothetical protein